MIDLSAIRDTLGQIVADSSYFPRRVWANRGDLPAKPYVVLALRTTGIADPTLTQTSPVWTGAFTATIVTGLGEFDTAANAMAKDMAELFPAATRISLLGGQNIVVTGHPQPGAGYRDGPDYRMPVTVSLRSE